MSEKQVVLYIAMSLDGFIADASDNIDFLSMVEKEGEDYGYAAFSQTIDTVIIGRKTYQKVLDMGFEYPHKDKNVYVWTRSERPTEGSVHFYSGDLSTLVSRLKVEGGKNIYCDGGAELVNALLKNDLIDVCIVSIIPVLLGNGIRLFAPDRPSLNLKCMGVKTFDTGLVQLHYARLTEKGTPSV